MESFSVERPFDQEVTAPGDRPAASSFVAAYVEVEETRPALQTNTEAIFNMLNNALGVSLLATAWVCMQVGLVPALLLYGASCYLNRYALHLVLRSCQLAKVKVSYPDAARACFGSLGFTLCATIMSCQMCTASIAYVVTVGSVLKDEIDLLSEQNTATIVGMVCLVPFTMIRSLKKVAVLSSVATFACVMQMLFVAGGCYGDYLAGETLVVRTLPNGTEWSGNPEPMLWWDVNLEKLVKVIPVILLSYAIQASSPVILASLENDSWENIRRITGFVYVVLYAISAVFGHSVYLRYTNLVTDNALTTIGDKMTDVLARWSGFIVVFISYIFMQFPLRNVLMSACLGKDELKREASYGTFVALSMTLNCALLTLALAAVALGGLQLCLRFGGGFCATLLAMVFPPMLFVQVRAQRGWDIRVVCGSRGGLALILGIGVCVWILSNISLATDVLRKLEGAEKS